MSRLATRLAPAAPLLVAIASVLPHARALWPDLTYYFRDFTVTFYPLRAFWAAELAEGRLAWWNPYVHEGAPMLPVSYPPDLLHVLSPSPAFVSWLLTLHFPLAAVCAYALARDLGLGRAGGFVAGSVFALSGLALSSLNLYVFLQALALAPAVALALRRAAAAGGRGVPAAALVLAVAVSTLAVEFVAQAVVLGTTLALVDAPGRRAAARVAAAAVLGAALAAVPIAVTLGVLSESVRGAGFAREVALGNAVHPVALLQVLVPDLFGSLASPVEAWWGGRFFSKGFPYLLSLYLGPLALALAATGAAAEILGRRRTRALVALAALGVWYALGEPAGLAAWVSGLPGASSFRFPSKAMLLPVTAAALLAGAGAHALARGTGWRAFRWASAASAAALAAIAGGVFLSGAGLARWAAIPEALFPSVQRAVAAQAAQLALLTVVGLAIAVLVLRGRMAAVAGAAGVAVLLVVDLARAGAGMNPQAPPAFFSLVPELAAQRLDGLAGGRVFSFGLDESPAFRAYLAGGTPGRGLWSFFLSRQMLVPYANLLDRVETAHGKDLTSFVPRGLELSPGDLDPPRAGSLLPPLRAAAVSRVLSLDPLEDAGLTLRARAAAGPPGLWIHLYDLAGAAPRLDIPGGTARTLQARPTAVEYEVQSDAGGALLMRDGYARGWRAWVDGAAAPVARAEGRYRAVAVGPGTHRVRLAYGPPGLPAGLAVMAAGVAVAGLLLRKPVV